MVVGSVLHQSTCVAARTKWTKLISLLSRGGPSTEFAFNEASKLLSSGFKPDGYALLHILRSSTHLGFDSYCQQLHCYILKSGFVSNVFVSTALIGFYRKIDSLNDANKLFVEVPEPTVVSWNSLISGYAQSGQYLKALRLFLELERSEIYYVNAYSFTAALSACGQLRVLQLGKSIHSKVVKCGLQCGGVANCLIVMYGKCGSVEDAIWVFNEMVDKDIISWNSVISACVRNEHLQQALCFFRRLPDPDTISYNEVINGIAQFGNIEEAIHILSIMPKPNSSSWNSIFTGYVNRNRAREALDFFCKMKSEGVEFDEYTFSITLSGIAGLAALKWGVSIHCCTIKQGLNSSTVVASALIDMYSKCGHVKDAESIFQSLYKKNLVTWNAMITGFAHNGDSTKVIQLFEQLKMTRDLKPDWVTFLNVLAACSHNEIPLHQAIRYFESMMKDYGIEPTVEHCCSMVRLMGQNGEVYRAVRMIYELGFGSYGVVWRALLGTCWELKVAKISAAKVITLEGDNDYVYVTMSNLFARNGNWEAVNTVRKFMNDRGLIKEAGSSWIEMEIITPYASMIK